MAFLPFSHTKRFCQLVFFAGLVFALAGCLRTPPHALRLGTNTWVGYEPLYLARKLGKLNPDMVKLVEYVSATQVMRGLIDGAIDAGALTLDEAILLHQQGVDTQVILVIDYSAGADAIVAQPEIKSLQDLRGRRVGVETTALGAYMMHRAIEKGGLHVGELTIVPLEHSQHEQAYRNNKVDAVVTFDPVRSRLLTLGANSLLDSRQLPGEVVDVLVVRKKVIQQHEVNINILLKGWFNTINYIESDPVQAARAMTSRVKLDGPNVLKAFKAVKLPGYKENQRLLTGQGMVIKKQAARLAKIMLQNNLLAGPVVTSELFDPDVLKKLYP